MDLEESDLLKKTALAEIMSNECGEGSFIDDLSHLRLSYYQRREISFESISDIDQFNEDPKFTDESNDTETELIKTDTVLTDISNSQEEDERQKLRKLYLSQIPDLPHPSITVASIIASASQRSSFGHGFKYENRIEERRKCECQKDNSKFKPNRRSTLKPNERLN